VTIDAIRCCKPALERGKRGILYSPSSFFMKHPLKQFAADEAYQMVEGFTKGKRKD